jgi:hypothetical protein
MILRYAIDDILYDLRRTGAHQPYCSRLKQWLNLRLASKTFDCVLSQLMFEGLPLEILLRRKQLEKLDFVIEALQLTADDYPFCSKLTVITLKYMCGKFWHNPDLSARTVCNIISILPAPHSLNFAVKLEPWILRSCQRSAHDSESYDGVLFFNRGDWIVDAGHLQIKRVSRWQSTPRTRIAMYLTHETRMPVTPVHVRLEHDRRWFIQLKSPHEDANGLRCMVNYKTKMVWDHDSKRLYDFEGRQYDLIGAETDEEGEASESEGE